MTDNPYSPPTASTPAPMQPGRPISVVIAVWLLGSTYVCGVLNALIKVGLPQSALSYVGLLIVFPLVGGLLLAVYFRRNWARWITVIWMAVVIILLPGNISRMADAFDRVFYSAQGVLQVAAVILLLLPAAGRWYRPNNSFKRKPLRGSATLRR